MRVVLSKKNARLRLPPPYPQTHLWLSYSVRMFGFGDPTQNAEHSENVCWPPPLHQWRLGKISRRPGRTNEDAARLRLGGGFSRRLEEDVRGSCGKPLVKYLDPQDPSVERWILGVYIIPDIPRETHYHATGGNLNPKTGYVIKVHLDFYICRVNPVSYKRMARCNASVK